MAGKMEAGMRRRRQIQKRKNRTYFREKTKEEKMKFYYLGKVFRDKAESQEEWLMRVVSLKRFLEGTFPEDEFRVYNSDSRAIFLYRRRR